MSHDYTPARNTTGSSQRATRAVPSEYLTTCNGSTMSAGMPIMFAARDSMLRMYVSHDLPRCTNVDVR